MEQTPPIGWIPIDSQQPAKSFIRPLVGSEKIMLLANQARNGDNDVCHGFEFKTDISDLKSSFTRALAVLRFYAPLVAADIRAHSDFGNEPCFIYRQITNESEALLWAERSLIIHDSAPADDDVISSLNKTLAVYEPFHGIKQYFGGHLLLRQSGSHSFYVHGSHSFFDFQTVLYTLRIIFDNVIAAHRGTYPSLPWGSEITNLPRDIVGLLGGISATEEQNYGLTAHEDFRASKASLGFHPQRDVVKSVGTTVLARRKLNHDTTTAIATALKSIGFTRTHLFEAATVLAIVARNLPVSADAQVTLDLSPVALQRFLPATLDRTKYITSCLAIVPLTVPCDFLLKEQITRDQLVEVMHILRLQHEYWLSKPNIPFSMAVGHPRPPEYQNSFAPYITFLGTVEHGLSPTWSLSSNQDGFEVLEMHFGNRMVDFFRPTIHVWSHKSNIHLQCRAVDTYDASYLEQILDQIIRIVLSILPDADIRDDQASF